MNGTEFTTTEARPPAARRTAPSTNLSPHSICKYNQIAEKEETELDSASHYHRHTSFKQTNKQTNQSINQSINTYTPAHTHLHF